MINEMATKTGMTKKDASLALEAFIETVQDTLESGDCVKLAGFGTFKVRETKERNSRNPRTQEAIVVPAGKKPVFTMSKVFKEMFKD